MYYSSVSFFFMFGGSACNIIPCRGLVFTAYETVYYYYTMFYPSHFFLYGSMARLSYIITTLLNMYYIIRCLMNVWWVCMAINISVQYNGGLIPDIILLTQV